MIHNNCFEFVIQEQRYLPTGKNVVHNLDDIIKVMEDSIQRQVTRKLNDGFTFCTIDDGCAYATTITTNVPSLQFFPGTKQPRTIITINATMQMRSTTRKEEDDRAFYKLDKITGGC